MKTLWISLFAAACGCGGGGGSTGPTTPGIAAVGTYPVMELAGELQCWSGESTMEFAGGKTMKVNVLLRRAWDAPASTVHQDTASWSGTTPPQRQLTDFKVSGAAATIEGNWKSGDKGGPLSGDVTLTGDAGTWSAWTEHMRVISAPPEVGQLNIITKVESTYTLGADHALTFDNNVLDDNGETVVKFSGTAVALDAKACNDAFSTVPPMGEIIFN